MSSNNILQWNLILEYSGVIINTGTACFQKSFELYKSRSGQLAWSPYKPGHEPHINLQDGVYVSTVTPLDIGKILDEITRIELKTSSVDASLIVRDNRDLVERILGDLRVNKEISS